MGNEMVYLVVGALLGAAVSGFTVYHQIPDNNPIHIRDTKSGFQLEKQDSVIVDTGDFQTVLTHSSHPELDGRVGFYRHSTGNRIYIQRDRDTIYDFYTTCVHEEMHLRGLSSMEHPYVYANDDDIVSESCLQAVYEKGRLNPADQIRYFEYDE